jgi:hypothetical protein
MLHIIYRSYGGENNKGRPAFYSKVVALASCIRTFEGLEAGTAEIIYLNDGPIPADRLRLMERSGEILACSPLGMKASMRRALAIPYERAWPADDLIWFAEDDYLYLPQALKELVAAATAFPDADYFALYALIDTLLPNGSPSIEHRLRWFPGHWLERRCVVVGDRCWQRALSTTSTFGGRARAIVEDRLLMNIAMIYGEAWDHTTCMLYQGLCPFPYVSLVELLRASRTVKGFVRNVAISAARLGLNGYQNVRRWIGSKPRLLIAPDRALATHLETQFLAVGVDWNCVAEDTQRWLMAVESRLSSEANGERQDPPPEKAKTQPSLPL